MMDISIDGVKLGDIGIRVKESSSYLGLPATRDNVISIPGRHGAYPLGSWLEPRTINLHCRISNKKNTTEIAETVRMLATLLLDQYGRTKEVKLVMGHEPEKYYKVKYVGAIPVDKQAHTGDFELPFIAYDPFAYAPATYYDPDVIGNYADSVYGFEIVGKHDANNKPIENPTLLGQIGGRNLLRNSDFNDGHSFWNLQGETGNKIEFKNGYVLMEKNDTETIPGIYQGTTDIEEEDVTATVWAKGNGVIRARFGGVKGTTYQTVNSDTINPYSFLINRKGGANRNFIIEVTEGALEIHFVKLEKGNRATDWTPAPEDEGWPMKLVIEDKFYGDGTKNDRLIFENGELYKEQWWEIINGVPILKDKPEKKLAKQKGGIYIAEGINTIHLTDDSGLLNSAIIRYQKGTIPITKGDNIVDIPKLDFNTYGVDLEYKNQVYSQFKNKRQYVGVYNYSHYETPFSFVIQGYCRNPRITNQTTGKSLKFNDLTLGANERLYVDSRRMTAWKIKIADDKYEFLTPHKIMRDYDAWDKINAHPNKSGDFLMLTAGSNSIIFESDDTPDAEIYLDWEHRFL